MKKIKITANILFSGIGCQEWGFMSPDSPYDLEVVNTSEINKDSILSYACIHHNLDMEMFLDYNDFPSIKKMAEELTGKNIGYDPEKKEPFNWAKMKKGKNLEKMKKIWLADRLNRNLGDISRIHALQYADLWFVSFPCQSISCAGKMKGFKPDSGTRSSLLWENIRLLKQAKDDDALPKLVMFENVKTLISKRFKKDFMELIEILSDLGYNSYWEVLNAKYCGIPQNRERVFVICIRKDLDHGDISNELLFPKPFACSYLLEDILEENVDEKYYINSERAEKTIKKLIGCGDLPAYEDI